MQAKGNIICVRLCVSNSNCYVRRLSVIILQPCISRPSAQHIVIAHEQAPRGMKESKQILQALQLTCITFVSFV